MVRDDGLLDRILAIYENELEVSFVTKEECHYYVDRKLDSFETMQVVVALENEFDIEFDSDELDEEIYRNIETVLGLVSDKINE